MKVTYPHIVAGVLVSLVMSGCSGKTETSAPVIDAEKPALTTPVTKSYIDERIIIDLSPEQREAVLGMMNEFVYAVGEISGGLASGDRQKITDGVLDSGPNGLKMPRGTGRNFPPEFKEISHATRGAIGEIGEMAISDASDAEILQKMSEITALCSSCHASYQIPTK